MDTNVQKGTKQLKERRKEGLPSPEGENQVGERKEQSTCHRVVSRCSVGSPKVIELEEAEGQRKKAMELNKGRITELIGEPDLLPRMVFHNIFLATVNTFSNILV
ncbi:hypothetical protein MTR67_038693 [Solanum verrucosum]|uniref:Uncharacterized protein n=1 Tax=Solanum verrucosum TaxID=315347 RepID=A0AAF0UFN0_SOLVR|nr:hypothetical protein MTR67_038693 [Solanum verrucosum]